MCTEPGGQTVAYLRLMWDVPSVQDHCQNRGWLVFDSYGVTHVYRAQWTDGGLPPTHLGRAVCTRPLLEQRGSAFDYMRCPMCTEPGGQTVACLRLIWDEPSVNDLCYRAKGGRPLTHMRCPMCTEPGGQTVACIRLF